ncbi:MAG: WYL domain-containing protein [Pseudomonadota bacterium]
MPTKRQNRLAELITILGDGDLHQAESLAETLKVSARTIYRDMQHLMAAGVPVSGTRGTGYRVTEAISLPPLKLQPAEFEALKLGLTIVAEAADETLKSASEMLLEKIDAATPLQRVATAFDWQAALPPFSDPTRNLKHMPLLRSAIKARQKVSIKYFAADGTHVERHVRPLHLDYWGRVWRLITWCETKHDFVVHRLDVMTHTQALPALFEEEHGKTLAAYQRRVAQ